MTIVGQLVNTLSDNPFPGTIWSEGIFPPSFHNLSVHISKSVHNLSFSGTPSVNDHEG